MTSVMISIKPEWCQLIASGKKTIEVRKNKPKVDEPFKVYIYCTLNKGTNDLLEIHGTDGKIRKANGKVMGEFVCEVVTVAHCGHYAILPKSKTMINELDLLDYADGKTVYGWHISNLVIYDKPKELSEFSRHDNSYDNAFGWAFEDRAKNVPITRPPQSWCYVEYGEGAKE